MKTAKAKSLASASVVWLLASMLRANALMVALNPSADTFITDGSLNGVSPTGNYGALGAISMAGSASGNGGQYIALLKFNLSSAVSRFDATYGAGQWSLSGATLQLAGNFATQGAVPNNARFPAINGGPFSIDWFSNDAWTETGVTYNSFTAGATQSLGNFSYVPPGNNVPVVWALDLAGHFVADVSGGGDVSMQLSPGNSTVSYLFNPRTYNTAANWPVLSVTAVPEPSTLALVIISGAALTVARRRHVR